MKTLLVIVVAQSLNLVVFWWFNRVAWLRILALRCPRSTARAKSGKVSGCTMNLKFLEVQRKVLKVLA